MNTALSWIKAYVKDLNVSDQEYTDAMTLTGTKVEGFERLDKNLEKIVIGQVVKTEKHPDADKLVICQVNVGSETIQIVTGAPNVSEGVKVPVVLDGGKVAGAHDGSNPEGGVKIKKGKLRGVESFGMMCSIEELGSSRDFYPDAPEDGLYILPEDAPVGMDAVEYLGLHDTVFEYEITSNRVDCYSIIGIAREAAATFGKEFNPPKVKDITPSDETSKLIDVEIKNNELCKRYCAKVVKDIKLAPSPEWMQRRLAASGIRPINNIVDITNYVCEEYGQPMHAFDYDKIAGHKIIVDTAKAGDTFVTLDGQERTLTDTTLMINDGEKAVGIAGIMGGENSKITDDVKTMLFEAATFDGTNIRLSARALGLRTEASSKFEKGLDPNTAYEAICRACDLIEELGAGTVVPGIVDIYPEPVSDKRVKFDYKKANALLGTDISKEDMIAYFKKVDLGYDDATDEVIVPSWRQDVACNADLAEEVARFFGYDKIPVTLPSGEATTGKLSFKLRIEAVARDLAEYMGFSQAMTYSFESPKAFDKLLIDKDDKLRKVIRISNPLGEDYSIMRTSAYNGMLTSLSTNYNRRNKEAALYELANIYIPRDEEIKELPDERMQFILGAYGDDVDFYSMKGIVAEFVAKLGMKGSLTLKNNKAYNFLHPGRQADIYYSDVCIGLIGEVHPLVLQNYEIGTRAYIINLDMPSIMPYVDFDRKYEGLAKFPAVTRDISMVVPKDVLAGDIEAVIAKCGGKLLENCSLFDIYEGSQIKEGFKSMAYSLVFRSKEKTLLDTDIEQSMNKILTELGKMNIELRS